MEVNYLGFNLKNKPIFLRSAFVYGMILNPHLNYLIDNV